MNRLAVIRRRQEARDWQVYHLTRLRCETSPEDDRGRSLTALAALVLAMVLAGRVHGEVKIVGPATIEPYKMVELKAEGAPTGSAYIWDISPEEPADVRELPGGRLLFTAPPGIYKIKCRAIRFADGSTNIETARHVVTIGKAPPPDPPDPPTDPLTQKLQLLYNADTGAAKGHHRTALVSLYRAAAVMPGDASLKTWGDLYGALVRASGGMKLPDGSPLPTTALKGIRDALAADLLDVFTNKPETPLTPDNRTAAANLLKHYADALEKVTP